MPRRIINVTCLLLLLTAAILLQDCQEALSKFKVVSLNIIPSEIMAGGDTPNLRAKITNIGGSQAIYNATLLVD